MSIRYAFIVIVVLGTLLGATAGSAAPAETGPELRITVVYDNTAYNPDLTPDWGFAALIEYRGQTILFDTGAQATILRENMIALDIDPESFDVIVLSHAHGDHTGGLDWLLLTGIQPPVYVLPSFPDEITRRIQVYTDLIEVTPGQEIADGIFTTGELTTGPVPEQALVIDLGDGLVIVTGCAHPGIVEIVTEVVDTFDGPVRLAMGGFHLVETPTATVRTIADDLRALGVEQVMPTHCTGEDAIATFAEEFGEDYVKGGVGRVIVFEVAESGDADAAEG